MRTLVPILSPTETEEFSRLDATVQKHRETTWEFIAALSEIKEKSLWREGFATWEDYCEQRAGFTRGRANQLLRALKFREEQKKVPGAVVPKTEREARDLMQGEPAPYEGEEPDSTPATNVNEKAPDTVVSNNNGAKYKKDLSDIAPPPEDKSKRAGNDRTGFPVPEEIWDLFKRWHEMQKLLDQLRAIGEYVKDKKQTRDRLYAHLSAQWPETLAQSIEELKQAIPYAVCCYCQGRNHKACTNCKGTGFVGKFHYDHTTLSELREMREAQIAARKL